MFEQKRYKLFEIALEAKCPGCLPMYLISCTSLPTYERKLSTSK